MTLDEKILAAVPEHLQDKCRREYYDAQGRLTEEEVKRDEAQKAEWVYKRQSDIRPDDQ